MEYYFASILIITNNRSWSNLFLVMAWIMKNYLKHSRRLLTRLTKALVLKLVYVYVILTVYLSGTPAESQSGVSHKYTHFTIFRCDSLSKWLISVLAHRFLVPLELSPMISYILSGRVSVGTRVSVGLETDYVESILVNFKCTNLLHEYDFIEIQ